MRKLVAEFLVVATLFLFSAWGLWLFAVSQLAVPPDPEQQDRSYTEDSYELTWNVCGWFKFACDDGASVEENSGSDSSAEKKHKQIKQTGNPDLFAQEGMWRAANTLVWFTLGQIFIGAGTIYLVFRTFRVQKQELEATQYASMLQLRPYLSFVSAIAKRNNSHIAQFHPHSVEVFITIKNTGLS